MKSTWTPAKLSRMDGKRVVVTGATNGIGLETARELARVGASVVLAVRNVELGHQRAAEIGGDTTVVRVDVADQHSIWTCADAIDDDIDILVNNAGVMPTRHTETVDGFEIALGTNFLGPFALTNLLLNRIRDRVVIVGSHAHRTGAISLDDPHFRRRAWSRKQAYSQSKLADMLWGLQLEHLLQQADSQTQVTMAHPGWAASNLNLTGAARVDTRLRNIGARIANDANRGAWPTLFAATEPIAAGSYVGPAGVYQLRGGPTLVGRSPAACDFNIASLLWEFAEKETGTGVSI